MKPKNPHLYMQIAEAIRRQIVSGDLVQGDKLLPVRELAVDWGCTPGTVSRAYLTLAREGLVIGHRGKGTIVDPTPLQSQSFVWDWAELVNQTEHLLLEALQAGHRPAEVEAALSVAVARWQDLQVDGKPQIQKSTIAAAGQLRFVGSHDLIVELIARDLAKIAPTHRLSMAFVGSIGGLIALAKGEADLAGLHLWDASTDTYNLPFIQRILPGQKVVLLTLVHRHLGLILPSGNPQSVLTLADLKRPNVHFVNRQVGSGTRVWLEAQLKDLDIPPDDISGFNDEETTHSGVARVIAQGDATVGIGIHCAAVSLGLDFIPLTNERYDLVIPAQRWKLPETQAIVKVVRSKHIKEAITALGGYDTTETGEETWVA